MFVIKFEFFRTKKSLRSYFIEKSLFERNGCISDLRIFQILFIVFAITQSF